MVIARLFGGLGNQMFQYAIGRSLSLKNNTPLGLDVCYLLDRTPRKSFTFRDFDLELFNIKAEVLPKSKIPLWFRHIGKGIFFLMLNKIRDKIPFGKGVEKQDFIFDERVYNHKGSIYLKGYWQNPKYFQDMRKVLIHDFSLKNILPARIQLLREEVQGRESLCIHVRRGDYVGNKFHNVLDKDYYPRSFQKIKDIAPVEHVYIFSDDIDWCRKNISFDLPTTFVGEEFAGEKATGHFELMRACKYFIIPNSTFSWWAAWLSDSPEKIVIAPKKWINDDSINTKDLIPPEWVQL